MRCMESKPDFKTIMPDGLVPVTDIDLRALSEIYDDRDIYLSVYMKSSSAAELDASRSFIASRLKAMDKSLPADLRQAFRSTISLVEESVASSSWKGERSRVIFAGGTLSFLHVYRLGLEIELLAVLDSSPFLLPLARLRDDYEDYGLLLLDSQEGRLFTIRSRLLQERGQSSIDLMNKHKKGGWSQMRYNRLRMGAIKSFLAEVVEDLLSLEELEKMRGAGDCRTWECKDSASGDAPTPDQGTSPGPSGRVHGGGTCRPG